MAEVTGELGGQPILLENAATEATLYALLQATLATNSNKSEAAKIQRAYEEALKRTTKEQQKNLEQNNKNRKSIAEEIERRDQLNKRIEEEKEKRKKFMDGLRDVVGVLNSIGNVIGKTLNFAFSSATPKVTDFTDALSGIPIIGPIIGAVGKAMQEQIDMFRKLSTVGADFGSGINTMRDMAARAGLPLEVFVKAITENSSALAQLGGNTTAGAKIFTAVNKSLQGPFQQGLARLGFSMEETADLTAGYLAMQTRLGRAQNMNQNELNESTKEHLLQLDMLSRVHGMTRQEAQKALAEQQSDKRLKLFYRQLGSMGKETQSFMAALSKVPEVGKDYADAMADLMLNNGVPSASNDLAMDIARNSPALVKLSMQLRKGTVSQEEANKVIREESMRMGKLMETTGVTTGQMLNLNSKTGLAASTMIGLDKFGQKAAESQDAQAKALKDTSKNMLNLDKQLLALREQLLRALMPVFTKVAENIHKVIPALTRFLEQFVAILNGPGGVAAALNFAFKKLGELVAPAFKAILKEMFTNPWVIAGLIGGFALLFGSTIVQMALARAIMRNMNGGPDIDIPDGPDRNKPGGKSGKGGFRIPAGAKDVGKNLVRGVTSTAAVGFTLLTMDGNVGQNYPFPQDGPYKGMEINPATGRPWDKPDLAEYNKDPDAYAKKTPNNNNTVPVSMPASPEQVADATSKEAMKMRAASIVQIKELTLALDKLDYNKLIIPETANKNIEISTGKMRLLRGEVNALTTSFKNLDETGLSKITKGINSLSGEFKIFNEGFSLFKKRFEELDRTTERAALESIGDKLDRLNTAANGILTNTKETDSNTRKLRGKSIT
jgi:hypothetical protein